MTFSHACDRLWEPSPITPFSPLQPHIISFSSKCFSFYLYFRLDSIYVRKYECFLMNLTSCIDYDILSHPLFFFCKWYGFIVLLADDIHVCVCLSYTHLLMAPVLVHNLSFVSSITTVCEVPVLYSDFDSFWFISRRGLVGWYSSSVFSLYLHTS